MRTLSDVEVVDLITKCGYNALRSGLTLDELLKLCASRPGRAVYETKVLLEAYLKPEIQLALERLGISTLDENDESREKLRSVIKVVRDINDLSREAREDIYRRFNYSVFINSPYGSEEESSSGDESSSGGSYDYYSGESSEGSESRSYASWSGYESGSGESQSNG